MAKNRLLKPKPFFNKELIRAAMGPDMSADVSANELLYIGDYTYVKRSEWERALREYMDRQNLVMGVDYSIGMDMSGVYSLSMSEEAFERAVKDYDETEYDGWESHS